MLYILLAGGVFNAVLVPQLVRAMKNDADGGDAYTNRIITLAALFLAGGDRGAGRRGPGADAALPRTRVLRPRPGRAARVGDRLRPLLPAAGVLLRHVRAGRAGAQRPRPLRADDVGADRQQRDLGGRCWSPTCSSIGAAAGPELHRRLHHRPGAAARASARRSASPSSCWCCCPTCARPASASGRASTSAAPASATPCASACGRCCSWWSTRSPTPWWSGSPPAAPRRRPPGSRAPAAATRLLAAFLLMMVPHSVVTVSLATAMLPAALVPRRRGRPAGGGLATWPRRCARRTP